MGAHVEPPLACTVTDDAAAERTYASLVQQYLSVLCYDNATFLAERMVARLSGCGVLARRRAANLLATCYYRSGSPKKARGILLQYGVGSSGDYYRPVGMRLEDAGNDGDDDEDTSVFASMTYLLAKCCVDLRLYREAEDFLLRDCREEFFGRRSSASSSVAADMDDWILTSTQCPIPNGAAGLNLLGTVCQKTNRRGRAADYFRMSLKLDPMMWSSYEQLCEMGSAGGEADDPTLVFGVTPPEIQENLDNGNAPEGNKTNGQLLSSSTFSLSTTPLGAALDNCPVMDVGIGSESRDLGRGHHPSEHSFATPTTPDVVEDPSYAFLGGPVTGVRGGRDRGVSVGSCLHATSLFHTVGRGGSGGGHRPTPMGSSGARPSESLFDTPGLTPIQRRGGRGVEFAAEPQLGSRQAHHRQQQWGQEGGVHRQQSIAEAPTARAHDHHPDSVRVASTNSAIARAVTGRLSTSTSPPSSEDVLARARRVAARLYYEPALDTTDVTATTPPPSQPRGIPGSSLKLSRARQRRRIGGMTSLSPVAYAGDTAVAPSPSYGKYAGDDGGSDVNGLNATVQSRLSFSTSSINTPSRGGGNGNATAVGPSNMVEEKRKLFMQAYGDSVKRGDISDSADGNTTANTPGMKGLAIGRTVGTRVHPIGSLKENLRSLEPENADLPVDVGRGAGGHGDCETNEDGGVKEILELFCTLGTAQRMLCQYRCQDALRIFHRLPYSQFNTGWVQHQVGRAYFETADYQSAQRALENMQRVEPHRMKGLEVLSTTLWHLKKEVELSHLAQRAVDFDRTSPESWCVVGNCFSLQKEHETALTFFRRSVQLDPSFTYSHTLSGHEFVANEDFDKAASCFRDAIRSDDRHYNAWYGLGAIYFRQEKYDLAEYHFSRALSINPQSSVLRCHLGMAQHANGKPYEALDSLADAFRLDPRNPQARYQRATIWMSMDRSHEALVELEKVRDAAPREASVHFAMGRVLKRLGRPEQAMRCFLTALDLDPKDNNLIKVAMDRLDEPDVDEDVSAF